MKFAPILTAIISNRWLYLIPASYELTEYLFKQSDAGC